VRSPRDWAQWRENYPQLPGGTDERVSGYGVMGVPFDSGHVLGLRRWTASSVGQPFTSIWHRDPEGVWRFYESVDCDIACSRWFGHGTRESIPSAIQLTWRDDSTLQITSETIDWTVSLAATPITQMMSAVGGRLPERWWNADPVLAGMQRAAAAVMGVGKVGLRGGTPNGQHFKANPTRVWRVRDSHATIDGQTAGTPAPLPQQAQLGDFLIPQQGIFAIGRVYLSA